MKRLVFLAAAALLVGCVTTEELPLAPNMVRLDTRAQGLLFTGQAVPQTMKAAAKATLDRGYTHFRFADASLQQGSTTTGAMAMDYGGTIGVTATRAPTSNAGATVIMFHAHEPGAKGAFLAAQVFAQYQ